MAERRQAPKATDVTVHIGIGGTALILRFVTLKEAEFTIAVPVEGARALAKTLEMKADEAETVANQTGHKSRH